MRIGDPRATQPKRSPDPNPRISEAGFQTFFAKCPGLVQTRSWNSGLFRAAPANGAGLERASPLHDPGAGAS